MNSCVRIRALALNEWKSLVRFWQKDVGIAVDVRVIQRWYFLDPEGFRVAVEDGTDRIIGMCAVTKQHDSLAVIGYLGVSASHRGKGIARKLVDDITGRSPSTVSCYSLAADNSMLAMYTRLGFRQAESGRPHAYSYSGRFIVASSSVQQRHECFETVRLNPTSQQYVRSVLDYDREVCGFDRNERLLQLAEPGVLVLALMRRSDARIVGYGKIQRFHKRGAWIGPLYADDADLAAMLISALLRGFNTRCSYIYAIVSEQGCPIAESLLLSQTEELTRYYFNHPQTAEANHAQSCRMDRVFAFEDPGFAFL